MHSPRAHGCRHRTGRPKLDIFDDILETLDLKGVLYFRTDFSGPWGVTVPDLGQAARFHLVVQGRCRIETETGAAADLGPGDLVLVPKGQRHVLTDAPGRPAPPLETVLEASGYDGRGVFALGEGDPEASTQMICGHFGFRQRAEHPLLRALPDFLVISAAMRARDPWLDDMLRFVARRIFSDEIGSTAAVTRLSEIVFIELLRAAVNDNEPLRRVVDGFRDRQIGRALELMHRMPEHSWTLERLASEAGMSRSRFAEKFHALLGLAPMTYLAEWRLQKALSLLEDPRCSVQQVAAQTGYLSPAAFSRAFSGKFGLSPTSYRRGAA